MNLFMWSSRCVMAIQITIAHLQEPAPPLLGALSTGRKVTEMNVVRLYCFA